MAAIDVEFDERIPKMQEHLDKVKGAKRDLQDRAATIDAYPILTAQSATDSQKLMTDSKQLCSDGYQLLLRKNWIEAGENGVLRWRAEVTAFNSQIEDMKTRVQANIDATKEEKAKIDLDRIQANIFRSFASCHRSDASKIYGLSEPVKVLPPTASWSFTELHYRFKEIHATMEDISEEMGRIDGLILAVNHRIGSAEEVISALDALAKKLNEGMPVFVPSIQMR